VTLEGTPANLMTADQYTKYIADAANH